MPTAPPSAAPELLVCLPAPEMQDRVLSKLLWQITYLLSPHRQQRVLAQKSSVLVPAVGKFGQMVLHTGGKFSPAYQTHEAKKLCPPLLTPAEQKCCTGHKTLQVSAPCAF